MLKKSIAIAAAVAITCSHGATPCRAQYTMYCINCSNELTQSLMHALGLEELQQTIALYEEAVQQTVQQIEMVSNLVKQYENMVQNTVKLPAQLVNQVTGTFRELGGKSQSATINFS